MANKKIELKVVLDYGLPVGMLEDALKRGLSLRVGSEIIFVYKEYDVAVRIRREFRNIYIRNFTLPIIEVVDEESWRKIT